MSRYLIAYLGTAIGFCVLDYFWLTRVAPTFYQSQIGALLMDKPNLTPALVFYVMFVAGIVLFCVVPALDAALWGKAALLGGLFGLIAYATYDLSNLATLKGWSVTVTIVDMLWGSFLSAVASITGYFFTHFVARFIP